MRMRSGVCHHDRPLRVSRTSNCKRPMQPLAVRAERNCARCVGPNAVFVKSKTPMCGRLAAPARAKLGSTYLVNARFPAIRQSFSGALGSLRLKARTIGRARSASGRVLPKCVWHQRPCILDSCPRESMLGKRNSCVHPNVAKRDHRPANS